MKRFWIKLGLVVMAVGTLGGVVSPSVASAKTKAKPTFTNTDMKRYYKSDKSKTAFYFKTYKSGKKTGQMLIFGDFGATPNVKYGVPTSIKLSKNKRTLTTKYKLIKFTTTDGQTTTSLTKTVYTFKLTKKTSTTFTTKLKGSKASRRLATTGTTYTYTKVKKSPAPAYAKKYVKPTLYKQYLKAFADSGALTEEQQEEYATKYSDQGVTTMVNNFNYRS